MSLEGLSEDDIQKMQNQLIDRYLQRIEDEATILQLFIIVTGNHKTQQEPMQPDKALIAILIKREHSRLAPNYENNVITIVKKLPTIMKILLQVVGPPPA